MKLRSWKVILLKSSVKNDWISEGISNIIPSSKKWLTKLSVFNARIILLVILWIWDKKKYLLSFCHLYTDHRCKWSFVLAFSITISWNIDKSLKFCKIIWMLHMDTVLIAWWQITVMTIWYTSKEFQLIKFKDMICYL